jgi:hypothetical protein
MLTIAATQLRVSSANKREGSELLPERAIVGRLVHESENRELGNRRRCDRGARRTTAGAHHNSP